MLHGRGCGVMFLISRWAHREWEALACAGGGVVLKAACENRAGRGPNTVKTGNCEIGTRVRTSTDTCASIHPRCCFSIGSTGYFSPKVNVPQEEDMLSANEVGSFLPLEQT